MALRLVTLVVVAAVAAAGVTASAYAASPTRPNTGFNADGTITPEGWQIIQNPSLYPPPAPGLGSSSSIDPVINTARANAGILPKMQDLAAGAKFGLVAGVFQAAAAIGGSGYLDLYQLLTCGSCGSTTPAVALTNSSWWAKGLEWYYFTAGQQFASSRGTVSYKAPRTGWYLDWSLSTSGSSGSYGNQIFVCATSGYGCDALRQQTSMGSFLQVWDLSGVLAPSVSALYATTQEMEASMQRTQTDAAGFQSATGPQYTVNNWTYPTTISPAAKAAGESAYGTRGSQTTAQQDADAALVAATSGNSVPSSGGGSSFTPFVIPQPDPTQDYNAYLAKLRSLGWVGTATVNVAGSDSPLTGPSGVVSAEGTDPANAWGPTSISAWPVNPPKILSAGEPVTLVVNSAGAPPAGIGGGGIDFTPLTGLAFGCKFPYGVFCYASTVTGWFNVSPVAPDFSFSIPAISVGGHAYSSSFTYDVNLDVMDSYMAIIRAIETVVLWIGAVWVFATRILGLQWGDPGEALEDGIGEW